MYKKILSGFVILLSLCSLSFSQDVKISKRVGDQVDGYWIYPFIKIENIGTKSLNLSEVVVDYYFYESDLNPKVDINSQLNFERWYYGLNQGADLGDLFTVEFTFMEQPYLEGAKKANVRARYTFNPLTVPAGEFVIAECGFHKTNWSTFDKYDDWSYDPVTVLSYTNRMPVTALASGTTVTGLVPGATPTTVTVKAMNNGYGSVELSPAGAIYEVGSQITMTAVPTEGYQFQEWIGITGDVTSPTQTFILSRNTEVYARFSPLPPVAPSNNLTSGQGGTGTVNEADWPNPKSSGDLSNTRVDQGLWVKHDLMLGNVNADQKFIFHPRNHSKANGEYLHITYEDFGSKDGWNWSEGIVLRAKGNANTQPGNVGIGTSSPESKLQVDGDIYADHSQIYVRRNKVSHNSVTEYDAIPGLAPFRYYEGISTGNDFHNEWGLHLNALSIADPKGGQYQDKISYHGGAHNFYTFDKNNSAKEKLAAKFHNDGTLQIGGLDEDIQNMKNSDFPNGNYATLSPNGLILEKFKNGSGRSGIRLDTRDNAGNRAKITVQDDGTLGRKTEISSSQIKTGIMELFTGHGNWLTLNGVNNKGSWLMHNPGGENRLEFAYRIDRTKHTGDEGYRWGMLTLHPNGNVGMGTTDSRAKLHVKNADDHQIGMVIEQASGTGYPSIALVNSDFAGGMRMEYYKGNDQGRIKFQTCNVDGSLRNDVVEIREDGFIKAKGFKVGEWVITDAPDYVFESGYDLRSVEDVEKFIKENKHLPEVPSAKEIKEGGVDLVEMNMTLLKKVEELTLYTIEQQKRIAEQHSRIEKLENQLN